MADDGERLREMRRLEAKRLRAEAGALRDEAMSKLARAEAIMITWQITQEELEK